MSKKTKPQSEIEKLGSNKESDNLRSATDTKVQGSSLDPYREATHDVIQHLSQTRSVLRNLETLHSKHAADIANVNSITHKHEEMQRKCEGKESEIESMRKTISTLARKNEEDEKILEDERRRIQEYNNKLSKQRVDFDKRTKAQEAEKRLFFEDQLKKLETSRNEEIKSAKTCLEKEYNRKLKESEQRVVKLQEQLTSAREELEREKIAAKNTAQHLSECKEAIEDITRAKRSISNDKNKLESELQNICHECGLHSRTVDQYKREFEIVQKGIWKLSGECIRDLSRLKHSDLDAIRENLQRSDASFCFVPISITDISFQLCHAHMQRVISAKICEFIWKPFSSDYFLDHPELAEFLRGLKQVIDTNTYNGSRPAVFWRAQTMRAIQTLADTSSKIEQKRDTTVRCEKVANAVVSVLQPLIDPSYTSHFEDLLKELLSSAIRLWDDVLMDEMEMSVSRSAEAAISPKTPTKDSEFTKISLASSQREEIPPDGHTYTLFPRIMALAPRYDTLDSLSKAEPDVCEVYVHPGVTLTESSPLVQEGKRELEREDEFMRKKLEQAKEEYNRANKQVRRPPNAKSAFM